MVTIDDKDVSRGILFWRVGDSPSVKLDALTKFMGLFTKEGRRISPGWSLGKKEKAWK